MGLRFRKSINLGNGFKVNISKSGIGYSWGTSGFRITKTAKGQTRKTYSIPGTGISYSTQSSTTQHLNTGHPVPSKNVSQNIPTNGTVQLNAGNINSYHSKEYENFLYAIRKYKNLNLFANLLLLTIFLIAMPIFIVTFIIGIVLKLYVCAFCRVPIEYQFDPESKSLYLQRANMWYSLNASKKLWQLISYSKVTNKKIAAGADKLIDRRPIKVKKETPRFLKTDMKFIYLKLGKEQVYFLPDRVIIIKGNKIGSLSYDDIKISTKNYKFIEPEVVPSDSEIIGNTWLKVNKNGTPDKRFKGNRQIPICKYGLIQLQTSAGMDIQICCSNPRLLQNFK